MYVNDLTLDYGERGRTAVLRLLGEAAEKGLDPAGGRRVRARVHVRRPEL